MGFIGLGIFVFISLYGDIEVLGNWFGVLRVLFLFWGKVGIG